MSLPTRGDYPGDRLNSFDITESFLCSILLKFQSRTFWTLAVPRAILPTFFPSADAVYRN